MLLEVSGCTETTAVDANPPSHVCQCGSQEASVKQLRTLWSASVFASILTVLTGVSGAAAPAPEELILSKPSMNFGDVVAGSTTQVVESIWNPTGAPITIEAGSIDGSNFHTDTSFPLTIGSRQQVSLAIIFSPSVVGINSGSLVLSLDGTTPYVTVPLYGVAVGAGQLTATPSSINFPPGTGQRITETISNLGATAVVLQAATASGTGFALSGPPLPLLLQPNQTAAFTVYTTSSAGNATGNISVSGTVGSWTAGERGAYQHASTTSLRTSIEIPVTEAAAAAGQLTATPSTVSFGNTQMGATQTLPATLSNPGAGPVTITQATASGPGFSVSGLPLPMTLTPGESVTFSTSFAPTSSGTAQGSVLISSNASNSSMNVALSGSASSPGQLSLSPASLNFGTVTVGKNQQLTGTLTASGSSITVSSASVSSSEFVLSGIQLPITIPAGQSASFAVTFSPQSSGAVAANVSFGGTTASAVESVSGAGAAAPVQHSVALSWSGSGTGVTGYNVYRGTQTGGPYAKLNSAASAATTFGDGSVTSGQTYYYVTTALDSAGAESTYSNEVSAAIPSP